MGSPDSDRRANAPAHRLGVGRDQSDQHELEHVPLTAWVESGREVRPQLPEQDRERDRGVEGDDERRREGLRDAEGDRLLAVERGVQPADDRLVEPVAEREARRERPERDEQAGAELAEMLDELHALSVAEATGEKAIGLLVGALGHPLMDRVRLPAPGATPVTFWEGTIYRRNYYSSAITGQLMVNSAERKPPKPAFAGPPPALSSTPEASRSGTSSRSVIRARSPLAIASSVHTAGWKSHSGL